MYGGPQVNSEEYLLGRKIDKHVEVFKEEEDQVRNFTSHQELSCRLSVIKATWNGYFSKLGKGQERNF